jgi:hypothetical protein
MITQKSSPKVTRISWGSIAIEGIKDRFKDAKLYPGGAREWDWRETGTRHTPGIQPTDVEELVQRGAVSVVLSKGMDGLLQVMPETLTYLEEINVAVHILTTNEAVSLYNRLADREPVGALLHSTC